MSDAVPDPESSPKPVVTLFESYGAGAADIGPRVARALGLPFHQQAFSSEQLEDAETQREKESVISRVFTAMGGTSYGGVDVGDVTAGQRDSYELVMENNRIVQDEARAGGVILGRNATVILAARPSTLHVKLDAPVRQRTARAAQAAGIDIDRAAKRQKREDQFRAEMSIQLYGWDPRETHRYDLVLNTGNLNTDICVEIILAASKIKSGIRIG
ncbi:MAG: cytidylate kinase family protein [Dermatophilaceae bacterium]